jgi:MFS family permease
VTASCIRHSPPRTRQPEPKLGNNGLYIRVGILETPTFTRIVEKKRVERAPVIEVLKWQPKLVALTALARMGQQGPFYVFAAFVFTYGTTMLDSSRDLLLAAVMCATALSAFTTPLARHLSDRIGRKRMYLIGIPAIGVFTFVRRGCAIAALRSVSTRPRLSPAARRR